MKKISIIIALVFSQILYADPFSTHGLIILLDASETLPDQFISVTSINLFQESFGALSSTLIEALKQKKSPILVSTSLLKNVLIRKKIFYDFATKDSNYLENTYDKLRAFKNLDIQKLAKAIFSKMYAVINDVNKRIARGMDAEFINSYYENDTDPAINPNDPYKYVQLFNSFPKSYITFDEKEWVIKEINQQICLVVPLNYLLSFTDNSDLKTGLKLSNMKTISADDVIASKDYSQKELENTFMNAVENSIFVTNKEYYANNVALADRPQWSIYLQGHGSSISKIIASLSIQSLRAFLAFLDTNIITRLVMFHSCFAGGENLELLYQDLDRPDLKKTFSYIIVSTATSESSVVTVTHSLSFPPRLYEADINKTAKKFNQEEAIHFKTFFDQLKKDPPLDFLGIIENVMRFRSPSSGKSLLRFYQIPSIKFPGLEWSNVVSIPDQIVQISDTLARTHGPDVLDIATFFGGRNLQMSEEFKKFKIEHPNLKNPYREFKQLHQEGQKIYPQAILLYAPVINFPLKLSLNPDKSAVRNPPAFISMIPGNVIHEIGEIQAPEFLLTDVINGFFKLKDLSTQKIFFIKKLTILNDIIKLLIKKRNFFR